MKFQNPSIYGSKLMLCITKHAVKQCPTLQRAITHLIYFGIHSKVNQVIFSSLPIHSSTFTALASIFFLDILLIIRMRKNTFQLSFHEESMYKILKP